MIYFCRKCERVLTQQEVVEVRANPNSEHLPHKERIVGIENDVFNYALKRTVSELEKQGRLFRFV